jgi:tetratricopeptide (TPR) repeat protein
MKQDSDKTELVANIYSMMEKRDFQNAGKLCEVVTSKFPNHAEGWVAATEFFLRVVNPQRALDMIGQAIKLSPENTNWMLLYARCLMEAGNTLETQTVIASVVSKHSLSPQHHNVIGMLLARLDNHDEAQDHYKLAVSTLPNEVEFLFNLATSQRFLGEVSSAEKTLDKILSIDPSDHEAAAMRSSLRKQTPDNNHVDVLKRTLNDRTLSPTGKISFCYALAKELEDLETHQESFAYLKQGADLRRSSMSYDVSTDIAIMDQIIRVFNRDFFTNDIHGNESEEPIFVIGLPRSGTTLLERILGSHSSVYAAGELGYFGIELTRLTRQKMATGNVDRRQFVSSAAEIDFHLLGQNYVQSTRPLTGHTLHFIDKLPFNYLYAGLIHRALPNAKIISLRRHPMDSCYSMYKQLFRDAYPFSYSQQDLAAYYVAYHRLMEHWQSVMPGIVHTVQYEDLVSNTKSEARRLLAHCGLDWEKQCLDFHKNTSASTTASATQVRQKVYTSSVGKWKAYRTELVPLKHALENAGIDLS